MWIRCICLRRCSGAGCGRCGRFCDFDNTASFRRAVRSRAVAGEELSSMQTRVGLSLKSRFVLGKAALLLALAICAAPVFAGPVLLPNLGTAAAFGLLGGTVSNTGTSVVNGNVGAM